jgi:tRNA-(ms[2]io[6]A)-hydroxylase
MLSLKSTSAERWLEQVDRNLDEILIDHAHCEKKAASCALNLIFAYVENRDLCQEMTEIVNEELEHFHLVLDLLDRRQIRFRRLKPSNYGPQLNELVQKGEPARAIDKLLIAGLIEARSCERFDLLRRHMAVRDPELAEFYHSLFESEARHHSTYVRLARQFGPEQMVKERLHELSEIESEIIARGDILPRMHS